jgi:hypothetical protein
VVVLLVAPDEVDAVRLDAAPLRGGGALTLSGSF